MRVHLEYTHALDAAAWRRRNAAGEVPDALPYGLDRLEAHGVDLVVRPSPRSGPVDRVARGVVRRAAGGFEVVEAALDRRRRRGCDAALTWEERSGVPAALRSALPGEPPVVTGVIWLSEEGAARRPPAALLARRGLQRAAAVWALSPAQLDVLHRRWGVPTERLHFLRFGIDTDFWTPAPGGGEPGLVVGAGNDRHRDHRLLVGAVGAVAARRPGVRLELATRHEVAVPDGLGARHPDLSHPAMRALYHRASVVAVALRPNLHVSGVSVVLEAMASGRPVVVSRTPGMEEYVDHGRTGVLVPPGDVDAFGEAVAALVDDRARAAELGAAARSEAAARFGTARQAADIARILHAV